MSSAPGVPLPPVRILDDATLINSIIVSALGVFVSLGCAIALFRRAWPKKQLFLADDSAIQFMTRRCQLLFLAAILTLVDAGRNLIQWSMIYEGSALPNFLAIRTLYIVTFLVALPLETYATCQRCAVIVTRKPEQRTRGLRLALVTCVACMLCAQGGSSYVVFDLSWHPNSDVDDWLNRRFAPIAVIAVMALLPLLILVSSVWALSVNVRRSGPKPLGRQLPNNKSGDIAKAGGSTTSGSHTRVSDHATSIGRGVSGSLGSVSAGSASDVGSLSASHSQTTPASGSTPSSLPPSRRISVLPSRTRSNLLPNVSNVMLQTASKLRSSSIFHKSRRMSAATRRHNKASLMYPLTRTFTVLTVALCVLWLFGLAASILDFVPHVRSNALNAAVNALAIALEASFELLIRVARRTQQKRQEVLAVDKTFAEDVAGEGDGQKQGNAGEKHATGSGGADGDRLSQEGGGLDTNLGQLEEVGTIQEHEASNCRTEDCVSPTQGARQQWGSL